MYRLGIDIGGTKVNMGIVNEAKALISNKKLLVKDIDKNTFFKHIAEEILLFIKENNLSVDDFEFCGVGVPGTVDDSGKICVKAPNLNIHNQEASSIFESILNIPTRLVQDSRAAAWAEYKVGKGMGFKNIICITLGTGIGLGIVLDGKIFAGSNGTAGEIGHNTVVQNGRLCSCGKRGCLGFYSAGLGLELTAKELLGENADAHDLFNEAKSRNKKAIEKLNEAIVYLGSELTSLYNNFAPDCIIFSGGLSIQKELYVEPLMKYIQDHIYKTENGKELFMDYAETGENAPMIGAALLPFEPCKKIKLSASIMCADIMNLKDEFKELEDAGIDLFHMDIMDEHFVPNMMLPADFINRMRKHTDITFDVHIMAENPEKIIGDLKLYKGDIVCIHYESTRHVQRALSLIKEKHLKPAISINPATPFESIKEVLCDVEMVLVMTVNPGFAGQKLVPNTLNKTTRLRKYLDENGYGNIEIEVDGNCSFDNIPLMKKSGANIFVLGTSSLFRNDISKKDAVLKIHKSVEEIL